MGDTFTKITSKLERGNVNHVNIYDTDPHVVEREVKNNAYYFKNYMKGII